MNKSFISLLIIVIVGVCGSYKPASADMSQLISSLMGDHNVTQDQATGGAGAVFGAAKKNMSAGDFLKVSDALPGVDSLLSAAPDAAGGGNSLTGSVSKMLGGSSGSAETMAGLADAFSKLGMDSGMAPKFVDTILEFANSEAGSQVANLLKTALF